MENQAIKGKEHIGVWVQQGGKLGACPRSWWRSMTRWRFVPRGFFALCSLHGCVGSSSWSPAVAKEGWRVLESSLSSLCIAVGWICRKQPAAEVVRLGSPSSVPWAPGLTALTHCWPTGSVPCGRSSLESLSGEEERLSGEMGMAVGSRACVKMWLACDVEVAELGSRRPCRRGSRAA